MTRPYLLAYLLLVVVPAVLFGCQTVGEVARPDDQDFPEEHKDHRDHQHQDP